MTCILVTHDTALKGYAHRVSGYIILVLALKGYAYRVSGGFIILVVFGVFKISILAYITCVISYPIFVTRSTFWCCCACLTGADQT